jgi:HAD superfamily hydrolase (TIGR01509 family)
MTQPFIPQPELVIFDCDGVLVDSEPIANAVFASHLQALGITLSVEQTMARFMGRSLTSCMADVQDEMNAKGMVTPVNFPHDFLEAMQADTFKELQLSVKAVKGVATAIDEIEALGLRTCIASSGDHAKMKVTLGKTGLWNRFEGRIFSATQVKKGKPSPDLFLFAAAQMKVRPQACVVIEDSPFGVEAAVAAGMRALAYCALTPWPAIAARPGVADAAQDGRVRQFVAMADLPVLALS